MKGEGIGKYSLHGLGGVGIVAIYPYIIRDGPQLNSTGFMSPL